MPIEWVESATGTNAGATASRSTPGSGVSLYIVRIEASYEASGTTGELDLKFGTTVKSSVWVHGSHNLVFPKAWKVDENTKFDAVLDASGRANEDGDVNVYGVTQ